MATKVHQFPGTKPAPEEPPEVDLDGQMAALKEHFEDVAKEVKADPGINTAILTVLTTDTYTTTFIRKLGAGMDAPGLALGVLRAQQLLGQVGD